MVVPHPPFKVGLDDLKVRRSIRNVPVCHVVKDPTEGVQAGGVVTDGRPEEAARPEETLAAGGQHLLRVAEPQFGVLHARKSRLREYKWLSFCEIFLEAKKRIFSYRETGQPTWPPRSQATARRR